MLLKENYTWSGWTHKKLFERRRRCRCRWYLPNLRVLFYTFWNTFGAFCAYDKSLNCGQSYKGSTIVNYDSRVVTDLKIPHITTLELKFTIVEPL